MRLPLAAGLLGVASSLSAQATVRGIAYDSVRNQPLTAAFVALTGAGVAKTTTSDDKGRFRLDSVPAGTYVIAVQHPNIDSIGFPGLTMRTPVSTADAEVRIAIPTFATLWQNICGGVAPTRDTGFVFGTTRDAVTQRPIANVKIDVSWIETALSKNKKDMSQKVWRTEARSDSTGMFRMCGLPSDAAFHVQASNEIAETGEIDITIADTRLRRNDLFLGARGRAGRGTVVGMLTDENGQPFRNGRVALDSMPAARSGEDGRFIIRDAPAGTRQVQINSIGMEPVSLVHTVLAGDTTRITAQMRRVTVLVAMEVVAERRRQFERDLERRGKFGQVFDSTEVEKSIMLSSVFWRFNGLKVKATGFSFMVIMGAGPMECVAAVWVDGRRSGYDELSSFGPEEIAVIEVYNQNATVPARFFSPAQRCGVVAVWTKYAVR